MSRCKICGNKFKAFRNRIGSYCSRECWYQGVKSRQVINTTCMQCGKDITTRKRNQKHFFCSYECSWGFHVAEKSSQWRGGHKHSRGPCWKRISETMIILYGGYCQKCHKSKSDGIKMVVDHIVPARLFGTRYDLMNDDDNLIVLCNTCHGIKTSKVERKMLRGDFLGLKDFYGEEIYNKAMLIWGQL